MTLVKLKMLSAFALLSAATGVLAVPAPQVKNNDLGHLQRPLPLPYNEGANAEQQVARAKARARAERKKLLIDLGGNWCLDCRVLAGVMALPEINAFVRKHYVVVTVDVGRMDKNLSIPRRYGIDRIEGVPAVLVVDPRADRLLNAGRLFALSDARSMTPQALADWLAQWL